MPREHRKRGKKHKKNAEETQEHKVDEQRYEDEQEAQAGPSWIVQGDSGHEDVNPEAPFGYVDPDVKAYFRTVDEKLKEWQELRDYAKPDDEVGGTDPIEGVLPSPAGIQVEGLTRHTERRLFVVAALTELSGKEQQLATDPDCSTVLERMIHSMDDFVKRVFLDRLAGS
jgi:nucleolar protein 9